ncbi:MAG TPA: hypothetical protein VME67_15145 [Mycobacterium sp.]|nr:hypothetical protein [Mycobacterium sp.]HTX96071.1 hypothetical protein [Mycobacterium sp.]
MDPEPPGGATRYRLLETVCQYALEKLGESGEADTARTLSSLIEPAETEIDNLRAAFGWCGQSCFTKCFYGKQTQVRGP